jgi:hypothetical protein
VLSVVASVVHLATATTVALVRLVAQAVTTVLLAK